MMKSVLILLVAFVAGMSAENCCYPDEFEIDLGVIVGSAFSGHDQVSAIESKVAFDYTNKRAAEIASIFTSGVKMDYHFILDYKKGVQYSINVDSSNCSAAALPSTNMTHCIPDDAKRAGSSYLGKNQLTQDSYSYTPSPPEPKMSVIMSVTKGDCIPLSAVAIVQSGEGGEIIVAGCTGYVEGIKRPSVFFDVPSFCPKPVSKIKKQKMFKHHLNLLYL